MLKAESNEYLSYVGMQLATVSASASRLTTATNSRKSNILKSFVKYKSLHFISVSFFLYVFSAVVSQQNNVHFERTLKLRCLYVYLCKSLL